MEKAVAPLSDGVPEYDAWDNEMRVALTDDAWIVTSNGPDQIADTEDDIKTIFDANLEFKEVVVPAIIDPDLGPMFNETAREFERWRKREIGETDFESLFAR